MNILINVSNLYAGGGVQVALSFLNELKDIESKHRFFVLLSPVVKAQIIEDEFPQIFDFYLIQKSPSALKTRRRVVANLKRLEEQLKPDVVFSVFGPSYWQPKAKHLLGVADGWIYNPKSIAFDRLSFLKKLKMRLHVMYKIFYLKRDASNYVLETNDAKSKFSRVMGVNEGNISVVENTYSSIFNDSKYLCVDGGSYVKLPERCNNEFRLVYIAHNHPSKNLSIINEVLTHLNQYNIKFILTLDVKSYSDIFPKGSDRVFNLGPVPLNACPSIYKQCDALFAPTLLETFSAAYPEAMKMGLPILTSNYSFATDICKDAALYFDPVDPKDIASKIGKLVNSSDLQKQLIKRGESNIKAFETAKGRAKKYLALCEGLVKANKLKV